MEKQDADEIVDIIREKNCGAKGAFWVMWMRLNLKGFCLTRS